MLQMVEENSKMYIQSSWNVVKGGSVKQCWQGMHGQAGDAVQEHVNTTSFIMLL